MMILLLILMFNCPTTIDGQKSCKGFCLKGQYCDHLSCLKCPSGTFQDVNYHEKSECKPHLKRPDGEYWELKITGNSTHDNVWDCRDRYKQMPSSNLNIYNECVPVYPISSVTTESPGAQLINTTYKQINTIGITSPLDQDNSDLNIPLIAGICVTVAAVILFVVVLFVICNWKRKKMCRNNENDKIEKGGKGDSQDGLSNGSTDRKNNGESQSSCGDGESQPSGQIKNYKIEKGGKSDSQDGLSNGSTDRIDNVKSQSSCGDGESQPSGHRKEDKFEKGGKSGSHGSLDRKNDEESQCACGDGELQPLLSEGQDRHGDGRQGKPSNANTAVARGYTKIQLKTEGSSLSLKDQPRERDKLVGADSILKYSKHGNSDETLKKKSFTTDEQTKLEQRDYNYKKLCEVIKNKCDGELIVIYKLCFGERKTSVTVDDFHSAIKEWEEGNPKEDILQFLRKQLDNEDTYSYIFKSREYMSAEKKIQQDKAGKAVGELLTDDSSKHEISEKIVGELQTDDKKTYSIFHLIYTNCENNVSFLKLLKTSMSCRFANAIEHFERQQSSAERETEFLICGNKWVLYNPKTNHVNDIENALKDLNQIAVIEKLKEKGFMSETTRF